MKNLIACCGLNCETCDAYIATMKDDNNLRKATAEKWQKMFDAPAIPFETINCTGCRSVGVKFAHCNVCEIRNCIKAKGYETCGDCDELASCKIVAMVHEHMPEALNNLKS
jgi:hypothetical protein